MTETRTNESKSTGTLATEVVHHLSRLVQGELALARAEIEAKLKAAMVGIALMVAGAAVALAALIVLALAMVPVLVDAGLSPLAATLVVLAALLVLALVLVLAGRSRMRASRLTPSRTVENVRRDTATIKEAIDNGPTR